MGQVTIKRVYEAAQKDDGVRILVDRLWPRGVSKERAALDGWFRDVAPSPALRRWWGHDPDHFQEFAAEYRSELDKNPKVQELLTIVRRSEKTTLVYAAKNPRINHALVLRDYLQSF